MTADDHFQEARRLRALIVTGATNQTPIQGWASVCRACYRASNAKRAELAAHDAYTRLELNWFNNLESVWWPARAQVETLAKRAAA